MSAVAARPPRQRLGEEERRAQIVRATLVVLAGRGYEQASLARIAAEAGVSKGLVSHYFADKETLLEETARLTAARVRDSIAAELDLTAPVPDVIRAAIRRVAHLSSTHHVELKAIREIVPNLRRPDGALRLDLSAYEETYQAQEQLFRRGQDEGTLRAFDTRDGRDLPGRDRHDARLPRRLPGHRRRRVRRDARRPPRRGRHPFLTAPPDRYRRPVDKRALVRRPGPRLAEGLVTHIERSSIDLDLARAQWQPTSTRCTPRVGDDRGPRRGRLPRRRLRRGHRRRAR